MRKKAEAILDEYNKDNKKVLWIKKYVKKYISYKFGSDTYLNIGF